MPTSRRSMLFTTMGLPGIALAESVIAAPAADAAATATAPGTTLALNSVSGDVTLDLAQADTFTATVTGTTRFTFTYSGTAPSPMVTIEPTVVITQDSTGGHSVTFMNVTWLPSGSQPALPLAANAATVACFLTPDLGTTVYGQGALQYGGGYGVYGDGSDGAIVLDGTNTYGFIGRGSQANYYWALRDIYASSLTIAPGCTLQLAGGGTAAFRLYCSGTLTNNGGYIVTYVNSPASGAKAGSNLTWGSLVPGANSPAGSTANATGAAGTSVIGTWGKGATAVGGAGGKNGSGTAGGAGGTANPPNRMPGGTLPRALPQVATLSVTDGTGAPHYFAGGASGGAGAGDGTYAGGAGGPGGNPLFIAARGIVNVGTIAAYGGNGAAAAGGNAAL
ncbi:hypothetical protein KGA66_20595, partial [Actinocrinis puniceicyclus]|nr:hypothetical protein [Actinocrinis puniceicyclus]